MSEARRWVAWLAWGPLQALAMAALAGCCAQAGFSLLSAAGASPTSQALAGSALGMSALAWLSKKAAMLWWRVQGAAWLGAFSCISMGYLAWHGFASLAAILWSGLMISCLWPLARVLLARQIQREARRALLKAQEEERRSLLKAEAEARRSATR